MAAAGVDDLTSSDTLRSFQEALLPACMRIAEAVPLLVQRAAPMLLRMARAVERIEQLPAVKGYEPFFIRESRPPLEARVLASAIKKLGGELLGQEALAPACMIRIAEAVVLLVQRAAPTLLRVARSVQRIEQFPAVKGYEPFFIGEGRHPHEARVLANAIKKLGGELLGQRLAERNLSMSLVALAKAEGASALVISRRAKVLGRALNEPLVEVPLRNACAKAGLKMSIDSLQAVVGRAMDRDDAACRRLIEISKTLRRRLRDPRGRVASIASVTHEVLLHVVKRAYTVDADEGDITDPATLATRIAIGDPDFDSRPASRRLRARQSP